jgi:hypothetical protein
MRRLIHLFYTLPLLVAAGGTAHAGPETALRELASGQVKKGVRTIGMGGDGATTGNYALVYMDAGGAILDAGIAHYTDTGTDLTFTAVGFTSPSFWDGAALYVIALAQHATDAHIWDLTAPNPAKPPSLADGSNEAVFVKFAKPLSKAWSIGLLASYEVSQMTLLPDDGSPVIRYQTSWLPSGGFGIHFHPDEHFQAGVRVILNHDDETRTDGNGVQTGLLRSYEYRLGVAYSPWKGTLFDVGGTVLDRHDGLQGTSSLDLEPNIGAEQAIVRDVFWLRAGLDESTWTAGLSLKARPFKLDVAVFKDLGAARTNDVFGKSNFSVIATLNFDYASMFAPAR